MSWTAPRTWSAGAVLTAAQLNTDVRDNLNVLSSALLIPLHQTGQYYGPIGTTTTDAAITANRLYAVPIVVPATKTYDRIGIYSVTGAAGNARLGIYNDNGGVPGSKVLDAGAVSVNVSGAEVTITISQSLTGPAKYWLSFVSDVTPTLSRMLGPGFIWGTGVLTSFYSGVYRAFTYAALPDPWGTATNFDVVAKVAIRAA